MCLDFPLSSLEDSRCPGGRTCFPIMFDCPVWSCYFFWQFLISISESNTYIISSKSDDYFEAMWQLLYLIRSYFNTNYFCNSSILSNLLFGLFLFTVFIYGNVFWWKKAKPQTKPNNPYCRYYYLYIVPIWTAFLFFSSVSGLHLTCIYSFVERK